jgi:hypothetical protein
MAVPTAFLEHGHIQKKGKFNDSTISSLWTQGG